VKLADLESCNVVAHIFCFSTTQQNIEWPVLMVTLDLSKEIHIK